MLYLATGRKIADPTTGLQGLSRKAVLYYSKYNHFDDKYPDTNMITQMLLLDFKVCGDSSCYACSDFGEKHGILV